MATDALADGALPGYPTGAHISGSGPMLSALSKTMVRSIGRLNAHRLKGVG